MFKQYLIKRGVGEAALAALLVHVKSCIERLARITVTHAEDLYLSSKPLENQRNIGSPRLWQHAVLVALGYDSSEYEKTMKNNSNIVNNNHNNISHTTQLPSIMLAMLSDSEKLIPGVLRACETQMNDITNSTYSPGLGSAGTDRQRLNPIDELHETAVKIWGALRTWGVHGNRGGNNDNIGSITEIQRDPIYQIILTSLVEYKSLQLKLCDAFYDIAMTYYGLNGTANAISMVCASLIPNAESMIIELFGADDDPNDLDNDDTVASSRNQNISKDQIYDLKEVEEETEQKSTYTDTSIYDDIETNDSNNDNIDISPPPPPPQVSVSPPQRRSSFVTSKSSPVITAFSRRQSLQATTSNSLSNVQWQSVYDGRKTNNSPATKKSQSSPEEIVKISDNIIPFQEPGGETNLSVLESQLLQELLESSDTQKQCKIIEKLKTIRLKLNSNNRIDTNQNEIKNNTISSLFPGIDDNVDNSNDVNGKSSNNNSISIDSPNKSNIMNVNDTNIESPSDSVASSSILSKGTNGSEISTAPSSVIIF
jgi:hypothetical protein